MKQDQEKLKEENLKIRYLRLIVDLTAAQLSQKSMTILESLQLMNETKARVLRLFPEKSETYDLIYKSRFERILQEKLVSN